MFLSTQYYYFVTVLSLLLLQPCQVKGNTAEDILDYDLNTALTMNNSSTEVKELTKDVILVKSVLLFKAANIVQSNLHMTMQLVQIFKAVYIGTGEITMYYESTINDLMREINEKVLVNIMPSKIKPILAQSGHNLKTLMDMLNAMEQKIDEINTLQNSLQIKIYQDIGNGAAWVNGEAEKILVYIKTAEALFLLVLIVLMLVTCCARRIKERTEMARINEIDEKLDRRLKEIQELANIKITDETKSSLE